jgi:thioredoxin 1
MSTPSTELGAMILVTDETFEDEVIHSSLPVVVDFYADWCGPCRTADPILEELSSALEGRVKFAKVNVDDCDAVARSYGIHSIPTYVFVESGREKGRQIGALGPATEFRSTLKKYFSFA